MFDSSSSDFSAFSKKSNFDSKDAEIGVVEITGAIMSGKEIIELLIQAEQDDDIKAIIVRINSPGGAVGPSQEIYEEIERIDKIKPVYASFGSVAASGGYYIAAAARKIYSNAGTLTGSIGVIMQFMNLSKLFDYAKVSQETIKAGRYKDIGNPDRDMTQEERDLMGGMVKMVHKQFIKDILKKRKDKIKGDIGEHAQGQVFSGEEALKLGLVDELAGLWQAGRLIHKELKLEKEFGLRYIKKKKKSNFLEVLDSLESAIKSFNLKAMTGETPVPMFSL